MWLVGSLECTRLLAQQALVLVDNLARNLAIDVVGILEHNRVGIGLEQRQIAHGMAEQLELLMKMQQRQMKMQQQLMRRQQQQLEKEHGLLEQRMEHVREEQWVLVKKLELEERQMEHG
jgi:hypothetical protein